MMDVEKQAGAKQKTYAAPGEVGGQLPRRMTSLAVAATIEDPDKYTKRRRPWRLRSVPFAEYLKKVSSGFVRHRFRSC